MVKNISKKKLLAITSCMMVVLAFSMCFASGDHVSSLDFSPIVQSVTGAISPLDIIKLIAMTITAGMSFVLAWFGIRKVKGALKSAIFKGKIR